jgi:hypothetical protein
MLKPVIVGYQVVPRRPQNRSTLQACDPLPEIRECGHGVLASADGETAGEHYGIKGARNESECGRATCGMESPTALRLGLP